MREDKATSVHARRVDAEPARRILDAARRLVGERGIANSHVGDIAEAAGLSRGLVRYYFGSKNGLLAEVMEAAARDRLALLHEHLEPATTVDELVAGISANLSGFMRQDRGAHLVLQELGSLALREPDIRARSAQLRERYRRALADLLRAKDDAGVIALGDQHPEAVAGTVIALSQGVADEVLADPEWDYRPTLRAAQRAIKHLLCR